MDVKLINMSKNTILQYNPKLKSLARKLRQNSTLAEILLWKNIKGRALGYEFHRQVPIDEFIIDFYCHELRLAIEVDGYTHDYNFINDKSRQNRIESFGIKVIRFTDADIKKFINDVIRSLLIVISEIEEEKRNNKKRTSPRPP
jgi:very-short-patch-repair endonuclease